MDFDGNINYLIRNIYTYHITTVAFHKYSQETAPPSEGPPKTTSTLIKNTGLANKKIILMLLFKLYKYF